MCESVKRKMVLKASYDQAHDVLYLKEEGCQIMTSKECDTDCNLILNHNRLGRVVGVQILCASELKDAPHWVEGYPLTRKFKDAICDTLNLNVLEK